MDFDYLRCAAVCKTTGLPKSTLYAKIAEGLFPKPIKLGKRAVGWLSTDVDDWKRRQLEASNDEASDSPPSKSSAGADVHAAFAHRESHDSYSGVIVECRDGWRIIVNNSGSQYIAQKRSSSTNTGVWIGKSHCTSRDQLLSVCSRLKLLSDANVEAVLRALPEYARDYSKK